jgi:hypothetical protein
MEVGQWPAACKDFGNRFRPKECAARGPAKSARQKAGITRGFLHKELCQVSVLDTPWLGNSHSSDVVTVVAHLLLLQKERKPEGQCSRNEVGFIFLQLTRARLVTVALFFYAISVRTVAVEACALLLDRPNDVPESR